MKTKYYTLLMLLCILFAITSCEKDDEVKITKVTLGAQANTSTDGFYAVLEDKTYSINAACPDSLKIDIFCFYEASTGNNIALASPGSNITAIFTGITAPENWKHKNLTMFFLTTLTADQFNTLQEGESLIISSFDTDYARKKAKDIQNDQVWSFKTEDNIYGLIKVNEVIQGADGSATFEVKTATLIL